MSSQWIPDEARGLVDLYDPHPARRRVFGPASVRFEASVERLPEAPGCWLWSSAISGGTGYGTLGVKLACGWRNILAHRFAYELYRGPIPPGLTLDHLCRVRSCVNPWHLEPVTRGENVLRGVSVSAVYARRSLCNYGHPLDRIVRRSSGRKARYCGTCKRARGQAR